jgi:hypothetical protein
MANRRVLMPADSPWRLVLNDKTIAEIQAEPAHWALEYAVNAIEGYYYDGDRTLSGVTAAALHDEEPSVDFLADKPSTAPWTVSFSVDKERFGAAALADDGTCYWVNENFVTHVLARGHGDLCTGAAALAALGLVW